LRNRGSYPADKNYMILTCDPSCEGYVDPLIWHNYIRAGHVKSMLASKDGKGRERRQVTWEGDSRGPIKETMVNSGFWWAEQGVFPGWVTKRGDRSQFFVCNRNVDLYNKNYPGHPGEPHYGRPQNKFGTNGVMRPDLWYWNLPPTMHNSWGGLKGPGVILFAQAFAVNGHIITFMPESWMNWAGLTPATKGKTPKQNARNYAGGGADSYRKNVGNSTPAYHMRIDNECWVFQSTPPGTGELRTVDCETGVYTGKKTLRYPNSGGSKPDTDEFWGRGEFLTDDEELFMCWGPTTTARRPPWYGDKKTYNEYINCYGFCICNKDYSIVIGNWRDYIKQNVALEIIDFEAPALFNNKAPGGWNKDDPYDGFALLPTETLFNAKEKAYLFDQVCFTDGQGGYGIANYKPKPKPTEHVCKHYESEDACPSPRCSWDGDACADPPCSSHTSEDDCCGDCEWEAGQCQPALFKACPKEGKPGTNVCPQGCTFVDNCEQCEFAAGVWKKDFSKEPWKPKTGARPQGCFRNRKFNIKCNKFQPGSKYPSGRDKVGTKRGKWPICKLIEPPKECKKKSGADEGGSLPAGSKPEIGPAGGLATKTAGKCGVGGTKGFACDGPTAAVYCANPSLKPQVDECCPGKCDSLPTRETTPTTTTTTPDDDGRSCFKPRSGWGSSYYCSYTNICQWYSGYKKDLDECCPGLCSR